MYLVRRIYEAKPGEARRVAMLLDQLGKAYEAAGTRSHSTVYFNSGSTPGDKDKVVMEWTDDVLRTPYRDDRTPVEGVAEIGAQLREHALGNRIEFWELMTDEKYL